MSSETTSLLSSKLAPSEPLQEAATTTSPLSNRSPRKLSPKTIATITEPQIAPSLSDIFFGDPATNPRLSERVAPGLEPNSNDSKEQAEWRRNLAELNNSIFELWLLQREPEESSDEDFQGFANGYLAGWIREHEGRGEEGGVEGYA